MSSVAKTPRMMPVRGAFGRKVDHLLVDAGIGRRDLAETAGIPNATLHGWISGQVKPSADGALAIARALGVPLEWLLDDAQSYPPPRAD